ncbi:MAG: hypothetical protein JXQ81_14430 [Desulfuromonadales bacterium]|nr:hypothetical protein [Desulfuromonadales bacterium]
MTSLFYYLHDNLKITPLDNDHVQVTVDLPSDLFLDYIRILDSLTGFARTLRSKTRVKQINETVPDPYAVAERDRYYQRIVALFDRYTEQGLKRTAAIHQISADLRKEKHPWGSVDLIRFSLVAAGVGLGGSHERSACFYSHISNFF